MPRILVTDRGHRAKQTVLNHFQLPAPQLPMPMAMAMPMTWPRAPQSSSPRPKTHVSGLTLYRISNSSWRSPSRILFAAPFPSPSQAGPGLPSAHGLPSSEISKLSVVDSTRPVSHHVLLARSFALQAMLILSVRSCLGQTDRISIGASSRSMSRAFHAICLLSRM